MRAGKSYVLGRVSLLTGSRARCLFAAFTVGKYLSSILAHFLSLLPSIISPDSAAKWEYGVPCHCRRATPYTQNCFSMLEKSLEQYQNSYLDLN